MRNKVAYSYSVKIHALGFSELMESIFCIMLVIEAFSLQKFEGSGNQLVGYQVNMADETKLHSTFEALVV